MHYGSTITLHYFSNKKRKGLARSVSYFVWLFSFLTNQKIMQSSNHSSTEHFRKIVGFEAKVKDFKKCPPGQRQRFQKLSLRTRSLRCSLITIGFIVDLLKTLVALKMAVFSYKKKEKRFERFRPRQESTRE